MRALQGGGQVSGYRGSGVGEGVSAVATVGGTRDPCDGTVWPHEVTRVLELHGTKVTHKYSVRKTGEI